jgi:hypothetical protein
MRVRLVTSNTHGDYYDAGGALVRYSASAPTIVCLHASHIMHYFDARQPDRYPPPCEHVDAVREFKEREQHHNPKAA